MSCCSPCSSATTRTLRGVFTHRDWVLDDIPPIVIRNWPGVGPFYKLNYAQGNPGQLPEQQRRAYRKAGVMSGFIEVDGDWYGVLGQTLAGMPSVHTRPVMALGEELRQLREDPEDKLARCAAALDQKAGKPLTGAWTPYVEDDVAGIIRGDDALVQLRVLPGET